MAVPKVPDFVDTAAEIHSTWANPPCCVFVSRVLARNAHMEHLFDPRNRAWWSKANLWEGEDRFANIEAYAEVVFRKARRLAPYFMIGDLTWGAVKFHLLLGKWFACQGWRKNGTGHTFFLKVANNRIDEGVILESDTHSGVRLNRLPFVPGAEYGNIPFKAYLMQFKDLALVELW